MLTFIKDLSHTTPRAGPERKAKGILILPREDMGFKKPKTHYYRLRVLLRGGRVPRPPDSLPLIILTGMLREQLLSPKPRSCGVSCSWMAPTPVH